ncbi:protein LZIC-like [Venturia canescens]|uniref:protein LZIC-like n=1 Tax=Venturia canescens TaxID=32260 RepID=UPI001C9D0C3C|nr:protein LZIC-like [Venturia canescens]
MSSHGKAETERLRKNLETQLDRLVEELADIEDSRDSITQEEYEQMKEETMEQLREFNESLRRMITGDMTLIDELGAMQLATQSAISAAFKTPAVIRMFGKREPDQLRMRLSTIERDFRLGKLTKDSSERQRGEVLSALKHLGEKLEPADIELLEKLSLDGIADANFVPVTDNSKKGEIALAIASEEVRAAQDT